MKRTVGAPPETVHELGDIMLPRFTGVPVMLMLSIALWGCGGNQREQTAGHARSAPVPASIHTVSVPVGPLTRAELIANADRICGKVNAKIATNPIRSGGDLLRVAAILSATERVASNEMERLVPPASLSADWLAMTEDAKTVADQTTRLSRLKSEQEGLAFLSTAPNSRAEMIAIAKRDGFKVCSIEG